MPPEPGGLALAANRNAQSFQAASANSKDGPMLTDFAIVAGGMVAGGVMTFLYRWYRRTL